MKIDPVSLTLLPHPHPEWQIQRDRLVSWIMDENDLMTPDKAKAFVAKHLPGAEPLTHLNWHRLMAQAARAIADREFAPDIAWTQQAHRELEEEYAERASCAMTNVPDAFVAPLLAIVPQLAPAATKPAQLRVIELIASIFPIEESAGCACAGERLEADGGTTPQEAS